MSPVLFRLAVVVVIGLGVVGVTNARDTCDVALVVAEVLDPPSEIEDGNWQEPFESTITVTEDVLICQVIVDLDIDSEGLGDYMWNGHIVVELTHDDTGTVIRVIDQIWADPPLPGRERLLWERDPRNAG